MARNLNRYVNRTALVSIPAVSKDGKCRPYKLTGIELVGLWLEGDDLADTFLGQEYKGSTSMSWEFFVPFSQIACVVIGTPSAASPPGQLATPAQTPMPDKPVPPAGAEGPSATEGAAARKKPKVKSG